MSDLSTKQKIINASIRLFNQDGMANVRLQQIANDIGISVGNLAYHFRNKEAIVHAINEQLYEEVLAILSAYRLYPNFIDFDYQLGLYFQFLQKHPFYFIDLLELERHYPSVHTDRQVHIGKMISQIRKRFDFNIQRGTIMPEPRPGLYDRLAHTIWVLITFWMPQNMIKGDNSSALINTCFKEMVWDQLYPYFTESGIAEYERLIVPLLQQNPYDR